MLRLRVLAVVSFANLVLLCLQECEELMSKGISGSGEGFDLPGRRLGGFSRQPPVSSLRKTAVAAAEKRARLGSLLPSGPKRLGGDSSIMADLSPMQAAAMAAERRLQDDLWCGSQALGDVENNYDISENIVYNDESTGNSKMSGNSSTLASDGNSRKRNRESSSNGVSSFVDLSGDASNTELIRNRVTKPQKICKSSINSASSSTSMHNQVPVYDPEEQAKWECETCTLLNPVSISKFST